MSKDRPEKKITSETYNFGGIKRFLFSEESKLDFQLEVFGSVDMEDGGSAVIPAGPNDGLNSY